MDNSDKTSKNDQMEGIEEGGNTEKYVVEKILNVRIIRGIKEYLVKWLNYSDLENTWEPEVLLNCRDLIDEFTEKRREKHKTFSRIKRLRSSSQDTEDDGDPSPCVTGFEKGLKVKKIIGSVEYYGKVCVMVQFQGQNDPEVIPVTIVNQCCPYELIDFYENHLVTKIVPSPPSPPLTRLSSPERSPPPPPSPTFLRPYTPPTIFPPPPPPPSSPPAQLPYIRPSFSLNNNNVDDDDEFDINQPSTSTGIRHKKR